MSYSVSILPRAQKELGQVTSPTFERACDAILALGSNPRPPGCRKLVNREGWRIRVGDYRVIYGIDDAAHAVLVLHVGHRRDIYS